jgi:nitrile hydratase
MSDPHGPEHGHDHGHGHSHEQGHGHHHHGPFQPDHPEPTSRYELMGVALNELLVEKGVYSADELRAMIETVEAVDPRTHGARIVARAWSDPAYKTRLLADGAAAVRELGLEPGHAELTALENTARVHNVVVCTLCSCYPRWLLGRPPAWYKSHAYRARVVREPRSVLREFGLDLDADVELQVHDSNAELRYLVVPVRPEGTDGWSEDALADLVTRDSMIGVAPARRPEETT